MLGFVRLLQKLRPYLRLFFNQTIFGISLVFLISLSAFGLNESPQTLTLDGQLFQKNTTNPLVDAAALITIQVINPAGTCILYEEQQTVNTSSTSGRFNINVGSAVGSVKRTVNDPGRSMNEIFQNLSPIYGNNVPGHTCTAGFYSPSPGDVRYFRITVTPSATGAPDILSPDIAIDSVPNAVVAQSVQGLERSQILRVATGVSTALTQANLEALFTTPAYTNLQTILGGNFMRQDSSGATLPSFATTPSGVAAGDMWYDSVTNQIKYQSNTGVQTVGTSSGGISSITVSSDLSVNGVTAGSVSAGSATIGIGTITTPGKVSGSAITSGTISGSTSISTTGNLITTGTLSGQSVDSTNLRVYNGTNYVQLTAQAMSSDISLSLPTSVGISGQVLTTNGSGVLSWSTPSAGVAGTISVGQGGTGATSFLANRLVISNGTGTALQSFSCALNQVISFDAAGVATCQNISTIFPGILIGGNSTGGAISLGTNDNQPLGFKVNNQLAMTISQDASVGIGTSMPVTKLDVVGEIKVGNSGTACSATTEGAFRWNSVSHSAEVCDGSSWQPIPTAVSAGCTGPNAFSFTNVTNSPLSTTVTSNSITPTGCNRTLGVTVTGSGNPEVSVNNGPWLASTTIDPGQTLRVRLTSSGSVNTVLNAVITIGSTTGTSWAVTTKAGNTRIFATSTTYVGNLGGLAGADSICQTQASINGYGGFWKAILSDSITNTKDRLTITYPVVRASDGSTFSLSNLWSGSVSTTLPTGSTYAWTGSLGDGTKFTNYCSDWSSGSSSINGDRGIVTTTNSGWINNSSTSCNNAYSVYCIEQPDPGCSVSAFSFANVSNAAPSTLYTSNTITPSGCASPSVVSVIGAGNPELSINGGTWSTLGTFNPGDTLAVRLTTGTNYNYAYKIRVYIGGTESIWSVSTVAGGNRVFATSTNYLGNMGGMAGADSSCQSAATTAGYSGTWKAIISDSITNAKDRLDLTYPVITATDGSVVATTNLWGGSILSPVSLTQPYWTGTNGDGTKSNNNCSDWTNSSALSYGDRSQANVLSTAWLSYSPFACSSSYGLACIEQNTWGCSPSAFSFTDVTNAARSTLYTSNTITPAGCASSSRVLVSGSGNPQISINGGAWSASGTLNPGDSLAVRLTTLPNYGYANKVRVYIGGTESVWTVTTASGGTKIFLTSSTYNGNLGGLSGADTICQTNAGTLSYSGNWKAILSDSTTNASSRLTITYPVVRASDGFIISATNLWSGSITTPFLPGGGIGIWTGSTSAGLKNPAPGYCGDWTDGSSASSGFQGHVNYADANWITYNSQTCNGSKYLICIEQ